LYEGSTTVVDVGDRAVLAMVREAADERLLVLANLAARDATLDLSALVGGDAVDILNGETIGQDVVVPSLSLRVVRLP